MAGNTRGYPNNQIHEVFEKNKQSFREMRIIVVLSGDKDKLLLENLGGATRQ